MPKKLSQIHNVFHVSMLRKYVLGPSDIFQDYSLEVQGNLAYEERPSRVLDTKEQVLRTKTIPMVKILWINHGVEEAT